MLAIMRKEIKSYFYSPVAYVLIGLFTVLASLFFLPNLQYQFGDFNSNLSSMGFMLIFIVPILTMRIIADDRKNRTDVLLVTSPISITGIVLGKYLATLFVFIVLTLITFIYPTILIAFGANLTVQLVGGYIGFILLGASFIAIGVFSSSLTENQVVAAVIAFVSLLIIWLASSLSYMIGGFASRILNWFSLLSRYEDFNRGIIGLSSIVYYISFIAVFLFVTVRVIEKRQWSQG